MNADTSAREQTFDNLFREQVDPWDFETSGYEQAKRAETIAALDGRRFERLCELGCATGVLTAELAPYAIELLALDVSQMALKRARMKLRAAKHVKLLHAEVPHDWPTGPFDGIVISEVLYFLSEDEIIDVSQLAFHSLMPGGTCLLVNWTGENSNPIDGNEAVRLFGSSARWTKDLVSKAALYRIDRFTKDANSNRGHFDHQTNNS